MKVAFISLGCAKNLVNTEQMMALCRDAGHTLLKAPAGNQKYLAKFRCCDTCI